MEQRLFPMTVNLPIDYEVLKKGHTESKDDPLAGCSLKLLEVAENARTGNVDTARSGCAVRIIREVESACFAMEDMVAMVEYDRRTWEREWASEEP